MSDYRLRIGQRVEVTAGLWRGLQGRVQAVSVSGESLIVMFSDGEIQCLNVAFCCAVEG